MKNLPFAIAIPIVVLVVILGVVVIMRIAGSTKLPVSTQKLPATYENAQSSAGGGFGKTITPSGTTATGDLVSELETTVDDGGLSEFSDLEKDAAGL
jgi:hypothetical protein